jgi:hypothetical protein
MMAFFYDAQVDVSIKILWYFFNNDLPSLS